MIFCVWELAWSCLWTFSMCVLCISSGWQKIEGKMCRLFLFTVDWHELMVYGCSKTIMTNIQRKILQIEQFEGDTRVFHAFTGDRTYNILNVECCFLMLLLSNSSIVLKCIYYILISRFNCWSSDVKLLSQMFSIVIVRCLSKSNCRCWCFWTRHSKKKL